MNFKQNINYFKTSGLTKIIGVALLLLALALYFFGWGYISYILMCISIPAGLFLFFWGSGRRASDDDIDEYIKKSSSGLEIDIIEDKDFSKRMDKAFPLISVEGYEYKEGLMLTKSKTGSLRSSQYTKAFVYVLSDSLYIPNRSFSLISDELENSTHEIYFKDIVKVEISQEEKSLTFEKKSFIAKDVRLNICCTDGMTFSFPAADDVSIEHFIEKLNATIESYKKDNQ